jgi:two-component system nitrate/nitrite response regulator NarL
MRLTPRQLQIIDQLRRGLTNKQIGKVLGIAEGTVKCQLNQVYERAQVANRTELLWVLSQEGG